MTTLYWNLLTAITSWITGIDNSSMSIAEALYYFRVEQRIKTIVDITGSILLAIIAIVMAVAIVKVSMIAYGKFRNRYYRRIESI